MSTGLESTCAFLLALLSPELGHFSISAPAWELAPACPSEGCKIQMKKSRVHPSPENSQPTSTLWESPAKINARSGNGSATMDLCAARASLQVVGHQIIVSTDNWHHKEKLRCCREWRKPRDKKESSYKFCHHISRHCITEYSVPFSKNRLEYFLN